MALIAHENDITIYCKENRVKQLSNTIFVYSETQLIEYLAVFQRIVKTREALVSLLCSLLALLLTFPFFRKPENVQKRYSYRDIFQI